MSLTKEDKEEIAQIVISTLGKVSAIHKTLEQNNKNFDLEELDKKWRKNGIQLGTTGLIIAPEDVEIDGKTEFTWDEAMALGKEGKIPEGWRLPTRHEWVLIAEKFGQDVNGELRGDVLGPKLNLKKDSYGDYYGFYWSSTAYTYATSAYHVGYDTSCIHSQNYTLKNGEFNVRCVKSIDI